MNEQKIPTRKMRVYYIVYSGNGNYYCTSHSATFNEKWADMLEAVRTNSLDNGAYHYPRKVTVVGSYAAECLDGELEIVVRTRPKKAE